MKLRALGITTTVAIAAFAIACGGGRRSGFTSDTEPTVGDREGATGGFGGDSAKECGVDNGTNDPNKDYDGDGFALKDDCNECNTEINKGAYDVPGNGIDEDCSGRADDEEAACDANIDISATDAYEGARAMGLCKRATKDGKEWGVISARWVKPDGKPLSDLRGVGVLPKFGVNPPRAGASMLSLSSGFARAPGDEGYVSGTSQTKGYPSGSPPGYPKESPACGDVVTGEALDGSALELRIRVPSNAKSLTYQQFFFTYEYPQFICQSFNDFFVTMLSPTPVGLSDGNIAFDQDNNPISVNNSLLQVCEPGKRGPDGHKIDFPCPLGTALLKGTGFEGHGGTGWLTTTAPVAARSEITLRFAIWDSEDEQYDSTVLIDDFRFSIDASNTGTKPSDPK